MLAITEDLGMVVLFINNLAGVRIITATWLDVSMKAFEDPFK